MYIFSRGCAVTLTELVYLDHIPVVSLQESVYRCLVCFAFSGMERNSGKGTIGFLLFGSSLSHLQKKHSACFI